MKKFKFGLFVGRTPLLTAVLGTNTFIICTKSIWNFKFKFKRALNEAVVEQYSDALDAFPAPVHSKGEGGRERCRGGGGVCVLDARATENRNTTRSGDEDGVHDYVSSPATATLGHKRYKSRVSFDFSCVPSSPQSPELAVHFSGLGSRLCPRAHRALLLFAGRWI